MKRYPIGTVVCDMRPWDTKHVTLDGFGTSRNDRVADKAEGRENAFGKICSAFAFVLLEIRRMRTQSTWTGQMGGGGRGKGWQNEEGEG